MKSLNAMVFYQKPENQQLCALTKILFTYSEVLDPKNLTTSTSTIWTIRSGLSLSLKTRALATYQLQDLDILCAPSKAYSYYSEDEETTQIRPRYMKALMMLRSLILRQVNGRDLSSSSCHQPTNSLSQRKELFMQQLSCKLLYRHQC